MQYTKRSQPLWKGLYPPQEYNVDELSSQRGTGTAKAADNAAADMSNAVASSETADPEVNADLAAKCRTAGSDATVVDV